MAIKSGQSDSLEGYLAHPEVDTDVYSSELTLVSLVSNESPLTTVAS